MTAFGYVYQIVKRTRHYDKFFVPGYTECCQVTIFGAASDENFRKMATFPFCTAYPRYRRVWQQSMWFGYMRGQSEWLHMQMSRWLLWNQLSNR